MGSLRSGSVWIMVVLAMVSIPGFLFWVLAAYNSADPDVGQAAAWFTVIQLIVVGSALGGPILINRSGGSERAPATACATLGLILAISFPAGLLAPFFAGAQWRSLDALSGVPLHLTIAFLAAGSALTIALDARLVSLRKWSWFFVRASIPSLLRVALLFLDPMADRATWILLASALPTAVSGVITVAVLLARGHLTFALPRDLTTQERKFLGVQHLGAVATQIPYHFVPFLVARQVDPSVNAAFYFVWSIGVMASLAPSVLTQVLLSESSMAGAGRVRLIRFTLAGIVAMLGTAWLVSIFAGPPLLAYFGPTYADMAPVLPFVILAALAWGVTSVCLTEARLEDDVVITTAVTMTIAVGSLALALALTPARPVWGATNAWLVANLVAVAVGIVALDRRAVMR